MINLKSKIFLFFSSYTPLFLIIWIQNHNAIAKNFWVFLNIFDKKHVYSINDLLINKNNEMKDNLAKVSFKGNNIYLSNTNTFEELGKNIAKNYRDPYDFFFNQNYLLIYISIIELFYCKEN